MDKLQELLKEYQLGKGEWVRLAGPDVEVNDKEELVLEATLISKKYGFIKWLVENKRIDVAKFGAVWEYESRDYWEDKEGNVTDYYYDNFKKYSDYESLLMLLSIQDEPIEFFISILK